MNERYFLCEATLKSMVNETDRREIDRENLNMNLETGRWSGYVRRRVSFL